MTRVIGTTVLLILVQQACADDSATKHALIEQDKIVERAFGNLWRFHEADLDVVLHGKKTLSSPMPSPRQGTISSPISPPRLTPPARPRLAPLKPLEVPEEFNYLTGFPGSVTIMPPIERKAQADELEKKATSTEPQRDVPEYSSMEPLPEYPPMPTWLTPPQTPQPPLNPPESWQPENQDIDSGSSNGPSKSATDETREFLPERSAGSLRIIPLVVLMSFITCRLAVALAISSRLRIRKNVCMACSNGSQVRSIQSIDA